MEEWNKIWGKRKENTLPCSLEKLRILQMTRKPSRWSSNSLLSYISSLLNWKWDFCLQCIKRRSIHTLSANSCGTQQAPDPSLARHHLCGMMQIMTNSFIPHHASAVNRCNTGMGMSWHLAEGLSCRIESFRSALLSDCCQASQYSPLAGTSVHLHSEVPLTSLCCSVCDDGSTLLPFVNSFRSYTRQCLAKDCAFDILFGSVTSDVSFMSST